MLRCTIAIVCVLLAPVTSRAQDSVPCRAPDTSSAENGLTAHTDNPDISGTWHLDRDLTTADMRWNKTNRMVVRESADSIVMQYFHDDQSLGEDTFVPDWFERPRYKTRIERAYARVRWEKHGLLIRTRSFLDVLGYQSYTME